MEHGGVRITNQIIHYVLLFGITGIFFVAFFQAGLSELSWRLAERDADAERHMLQLGERVKLIGFVDRAPVEADIMNVGESAVNVRYVLVDGAVSAYSMEILHNGTAVGDIPVGEIVRMRTGSNGNVLTIISDNDKAYRFAE